MEVMIFKIGEIMGKKFKIKDWCHQEEGYPYFLDLILYLSIYTIELIKDSLLAGLMEFNKMFCFYSYIDDRIQN